MTELERRHEILDPFTGELVPADDPDSLAALYAKLRSLNAQVREAQREIAYAFRDLAAVHATGTFHLEDGSTVTVTKGTETYYDAEAIETELRAAGMPEAAIREIVEETVVTTLKVKAGRAKQAASRNPTYAEIIERNSRTVEKTPYPRLSEPTPGRVPAKPAKETDQSEPPSHSSP